MSTSSPSKPPSTAVGGRAVLERDEHGQLEGRRRFSHPPTVRFVNGSRLGGRCWQATDWIGNALSSDPFHIVEGHPLNRQRC